jgi:hypothetical protein
MTNMNTFKRNFYIQIALTIVGLLPLISGCIDNKDWYNAEETAKIKSTLYDFKLRNEIALQVNYNTINYPVEVQLYDENPLAKTEEGAIVRSSAEPLYIGYTDQSGILNTKVEIPKAAKTVYLFTNNIGVPECIETKVENSAISFTRTKTEPIPVEGEAITRGTGANCCDIGSHYYTISSSKKLYELYYPFTSRSNEYNYTYSRNWYNYWFPTAGYTTSNWYSTTFTAIDLYKQVADDAKLTTSSTLSDLKTRVSQTLIKGVDNSAYVADANKVNVTIKSTNSSGTTIKNAHLDLVFLNATGLYRNALVYYYYPSNATITDSYLKSLPKYVVFPKLTGWYGNKSGKPMPDINIKARLQFFGANYDQPGDDDFPTGYTVGWMLIPDIGTTDTSYFGTVNDAINSKYSQSASNTDCIYSNNISNYKQKERLCQTI